MEKRRVPRIAPFVIPCRVRAGLDQFSAFLTDISVEGARLCSDREVLQVATEVVIEVRLDRRRIQPARLPGTVVWVRAGERGEALFGVRFAALASEDQEVLAQAVADFVRLAERL